MCGSGGLLLFAGVLSLIFSLTLALFLSLLQKN
nr:MAG TPA: hypothetical protein [Caudoviricetes sp.]